ncbi:M23 family metallopeptidase [Desulfosarcina sp.]|uniref:M23 family metallopeptidase n=1 Tax=Desulfosarcina sp. TaxID=2027861 RepID=UPI0029B5A362|nr:peptidoglycan DD-metalloendopeptidase family protein [Desulfosarcina sp.]MDX2453761.1 peptidoglycan DD-metalloendopeptidase family protein [Desulfosarcina sp.]MDX2491459.1 peptidoglycan DD-metalloendopeptidase family protein [Desulfosarcina sp.]
MAKKISLIILSNSGTTVKQLAIPVVLLTALALVTALGVALVGIAFHDYQSLRNSLGTSNHIAQTIEEQREEIGQQRLQIQAFAHEINALKEKLVELDQFEEKIRVIANLAPGQTDGNLFGVGGAAPEDLEPQLELTQRHEGLMREMHQQVDELASASQRQENSFGNLLDKLEGQRNLLASTPAIRPTGGWMTSRFGHRVSPFTGRKELHKGVDIANRKGTAILATANGIVSFAGKKGPMGNVVVIDHGHGMITRYAHLSEALKKQGDTVKRGDIIAQMGNSGRSTGPHLHYEVHLNGVPVNPVTYILN